VLALLDKEVPDAPGAREGAQTRVLGLPREVRVRRVRSGVAGDRPHRLKVRQQGDEGHGWHRADLRQRLPDAATRRVHAEALRPTVGRPDLGTLPSPTDPPVLAPRHVPHQPGHVLGVEGRLPAHLCRRQALKGTLEVLQGFLQSALDGFFACAHSRCPHKLCADPMMLD